MSIASGSFYRCSLDYISPDPGSKRAAADAPPPQRRRLHFVGRYADVARALGELCDGTPLGVPVGLTMKTRGALPPAWVLTVWL